MLLISVEQEPNHPNVTTVGNLDTIPVKRSRGEQGGSHLMAPFHARQPRPAGPVQCG